MRMTVSRVMPGRQDDVVGGVDEHAVAHDEHVLARAVGEEALLVQQDRLVVARPSGPRSSRAASSGTGRDALAAAGTVFGPIRRHDEVVTRTPVSSASSPR